MNVFYIEIDKFKNTHSKDFLTSYADKELKTDKRFYEYTLGRYLIKKVAKEYYDIADTSIIINKSGKPLFKHSSICFSLTHTKNIVMVCFDKYNCGIDLEYGKNRNLKYLSKYFGERFNTSEDFYKFWTLKEASLKLADTIVYQHFQQFYKDYYLTVVSSKNRAHNIKILKVD